MSCWLTRDVRKRITEARNAGLGPHRWPEGCRGAERAWLVFVGPSPGGQNGERDERGFDVPFRDEVFWEPVKDWSGGFRASMRPLVEQITGLPFHQSGRTFAVANFDYVKNPDAGEVGLEKMSEGIPAVLRVLRETRPRVIVPMEARSTALLIAGLVNRLGAQLKHRFVSRRILISPASGRKHPGLNIWKVESDRANLLTGSYVVQLPQHPARIYGRKYALRVGKAVHRAVGVG